MNSDGYVLVVGAAGKDIKARPDDALLMGTTNPGRVRNAVGGVARNIAENLARLEVPTILLSAVGHDVQGKRVLRQCKEAGIDCSHVRRVNGARTFTYFVLLKPDGDLMVAVTDYEIMRYIDRDYLLGHEGLFIGADFVVIDTMLTDEALSTVFELAERHGVRVCADPTDPSLAKKLLPYIPKLYLVVPNAAETSALCGLDTPASNRETALNAARQLVAMGAEIAVVTLGEHGLAYADSSGSGYIRAIHTQVLDTTGAGDAFSGAVIFGLLNEVPVDEAMRLGVTAASLTLQTPATVLQELNQELLYSRLVV